ncbi:MAG: hypothetical protein CVU65_02765 [Deltaproteobacteria bacterium HGW-Deltaproteobacteria-22]|nr:MAG: hypothetical protein CVU65_02765 [Deltaproteobacteria bacterium HGW-Deltaproteobacteria-22]
MHLKNVLLAGLFVGLSILFGCAQLRATSVRPVSVPITPGRSVLLVLDNPIPSQPGVARAANDLIWGVGRRLVRAGVQVQAVRALPPSYAQDVVVIMQIEHFRHVKPSDRLWKGAFAGRAELTVRVLVYERDREESSGEVRIESRTGTHGFAGTDDEAVEAAIGQVASFLLR